MGEPYNITPHKNTHKNTEKTQADPWMRNSSRNAITYPSYYTNPTFF